MEQRTIHITGVGHVTQAPDTVVVSLRLTASNPEYAAAVTIGNQQIEMLREAIVEAGFDADDLKTTSFDVRAVYEDEEYREGNSKRYRRNLTGFECVHDLKLTFDIDNAKLNAAIDTIAVCLSEPKLSVAFTVKDTDALADKILEAAARDALRKAKILCAAADVKLGRLIRVDYPRDELTVHDAPQAVLAASTDSAFDFQPDDVTATDSVKFIWEID
ncbi:MAG: SIMPL domain-containing protein [Quinella sp. 2Q5]|nr:SIMPL domain-containing protein [Quinella sp. 2Q5]